MDTSRQELYSDHKNTNSYFIFEHSNNWKYGEEYQAEYRCTDDNLFLMIEPIIKELEKIYDGRIAKCLFIRLPSKKDVKEHKDNGDYLNAVKRCHIAIETNEETFFYVNNEKKNMEVGDCWEINNMKSHYVKNDGETDRIHLLIDILPNDLFSKS